MTWGHRNDSIDCAKAIAIFAVVLFHITRGFTTSGIIGDMLWLRIADATAYGFHVQTFFLISGYLAYRRAGEIGFQLRRQSFLYYAYLLWSLVYCVLGLAFATSVNTPPTLHNLLLIPVAPTLHFWFIFTLMGGTALLAVLRTPMLLIAGIILVAATFAFSPNVIGSSIVYILIGGLLGALNYKPRVSLPPLLACALGLIAFYSAAIMRSWYVPPIAGLLPALAGAYACYGFGSFMSRNPRVSAVAAYCGRHTMSVYLLHVLAGAGLRIVLFHMAPGFNPWLGILLCTLISIAGPLLVEEIARRTRTSALLGFEPWLAPAPARPAEAAAPAAP